MVELNLGKVKKVYIIGIKGAGVVSIAQILKSRGIEVSGSDTKEKFFTDEILQKLKIKYHEGFLAENVPSDVDLVVYSTSYNESNNVELAEAKKKKLNLISFPEILGQLFNQKYGLAVCGTHGKTTTSALLASALKNSGVDPVAMVGSKVIEWGTSALMGHGEYFVAETDEFQDKLRFFNPKAIILTSVDWDHPDFFKTPQEYTEVFCRFVSRLPRTGFLIVWGDSTATLEVSKSAPCEVIKYGFSDDNDVRVKNYELRIGNEILKNIETPVAKMQAFAVYYKNKNLGMFEINLAGKHNVLNAAAVISVCHKLNLNMDKVREALQNFKGTARRFEYKGKRNGAIVIDDYAHHPEEIKATLKAAREIYGDKNIWVIFHPHTFTRTKALLAEFSQSFEDASRVIVLDIYGSAREVQGGVSSADLVTLINQYSRGKAEYIPTISQAVEFLKDKIGDHDVVIAMGAGNVWEAAEKLATVIPARFAIAPARRARFAIAPARRAKAGI